MLLPLACMGWSLQEILRNERRAYSTLPGCETEPPDPYSDAFMESMPWPPPRPSVSELDAENEASGKLEPDELAQIWRQAVVTSPHACADLSWSPCSMARSPLRPAGMCRQARSMPATSSSLCSLWLSAKSCPWRGALRTPSSCSIWAAVLTHPYRHEQAKWTWTKRKNGRCRGLPPPVAPPPGCPCPLHFPGLALRPGRP